ncbi:TetR/AcrR family transcriptional regulator [Lacticaseibacillus saniviri]
MDLRQVKTERNIQRAFIQLLTEQEFEKVTVADIGHAAEISRSTFYDHYADKYELLEKMIAHYTDYLFEISQRRIDALLARDRHAFEQSIVEIADQLLAERQTLSVLLNLEVPGLSLSANWKQVLQEHWHQVIQDQGLTSQTPESYVSETCTDLVINFAKWTLENGKNDATITQLRKLLSSMFDQLITE